MRAHFDVEEFSRVWQESLTREEAAKRLGLNPHTASNRARWLRDRGHPLRMFGVHRGKAPLAPPPVSEEERIRRTFRRLRRRLRRQEERAVKALRDVEAARKMLDGASVRVAPRTTRGAAGSSTGSATSAGARTSWSSGSPAGRTNG